MTDSVKIIAQNSFGDVNHCTMDNPSCKGVVAEVVESLKLLGFSNMQIYIALNEQADKVADEIRK